jgi:hypothetical protein
MKFNMLPLFAAALLGQAAAAQGTLQEPGSLLVFHEFNNRHGVQNLITVTNTADGDATTDTINVEYVYRARYGYDGQELNCLETNRTRTLTPNDTLSVFTVLDNPNYEQGYLYVFAKSRTTGRAVKFDHLIGTNLVLDGVLIFDYQVNPAVFKAGEALASGAQTDLDSDGIRDLNGNEYAQAPDQILIPRFIGNIPHFLESELVLVNLTGGAAFTSILDFLAYNDNEEVFSTQYQFKCWDRVPLLEISGIFANAFLATTNHAANEIAGATTTETGWIRIDGNTAFSTNTQIDDPAFLAVLVERLIVFEAASLPFGQGTQNNGDLLPLSILGDNGQ